MAKREKKIYLTKNSRHTGVPARYKVTRVLNTLDVEPGQYLEQADVKRLMETHEVVIDPSR